MKAFLEDEIDIEETIPLSTQMERIDDEQSASPAVSVSEIAPVVTTNGHL